MTENERLAEIYRLYKDWLKSNQSLFDAFKSGYELGFSEGLKKPLENIEE
jgi:hypothetical protein